MEKASVLLCFLLMTGCHPDEPEPTSLNAFSMMVDGQLWQPFQDEDDPCSSTYIGTFGQYGEQPIYTIYAYRDPNGIDDYRSENFLRTRIMDVTDTGTYLLDGTYKNDFDSYFIFFVQQPPLEKAKRYVNDPARTPFYFYVEEFFPIEDSDSRGFRGSFDGTLYNEVDPEDSLVISEGKFKFHIINYNNHCSF